MDDLTGQFRQIAQYPDSGPTQPGDQLLLQRGGFGGPYLSLDIENLFSSVTQGVTIGLYPQRTNRGLVSSFLVTPNGFRQGWNFYVDSATGQERYLQNGVAGQWSFAENRLKFAIAVEGVLDQPVWDWIDLFSLSYSGALTLREQLAVGRDPVLNNEVTTINWVTNNTVRSFMGRTGAIELTVADINAAMHLMATDTVASQNWVNQQICSAVDALYAGNPFVYTFNGRVGDITLTTADVNAAYFTPGAPFPQSVTPPLGDVSNRIATTMFVDESFEEFYRLLQSEISASIDLSAYAPLASPQFSGVPTAPTASPGSSTGQLATTAFVANAIVASTTGVSSFNTRTGAVTLTLADVTGAGGAPLNSPAFTGSPTAPTPTTGNSSTLVATTAFVAAALAAGAGVTSFNTRTGAITLNLGDVTATGVLNNTPLTGVPTAPTAAPATATTQLATTAFVTAAVNGSVLSFEGRTGAVVLQANDISAAGGALLSSPAFTGTPTAPTPVGTDNSTKLATTAFVQAAIGVSGVTSFNGRSGVVTLTLGDITTAGGAPVASPAFTGAPVAPTPAPGTNNTTIATTAFVTAALAGAAVVSSFNGRNGAVTLSLADVTGVGGAPTSSPTFTGVPVAPTAAPATNTTQVATTAFVAAAIALTVNSFNGRTGTVTLQANDVSAVGGALLAGPAFTGSPTAPTAAPGTSTTQLATTAFVAAAISASTGTGAVRYDISQTLTTPQLGVALQNIGAVYARLALVNGKITESHASNAATFSIVGLDGNAPSATNPVLAVFSDGSILAITSAVSLTFPSGCKFGTSNATAFRLWLVLFNDAGTARIGAVVTSITNAGAAPFGAQLYGIPRPAGSSTAISTAAVAGTIYTGAAVTSKPLVIIGNAEYDSGLATAGAWAVSPTRINLHGAGMPRPGDVIAVYSQAGSPGQAISTGTATELNSSRCTATPTTLYDLFQYDMCVTGQTPVVASVNSQLLIRVLYNGSGGYGQAGGYIFAGSGSGGLNACGGVSTSTLSQPLSLATQNYSPSGAVAGSYTAQANTFACTLTQLVG